MSNWSELRNNFYNTEECCWCIDGWRTADHSKESEVIAKVFDDGKVEYLDETAMKDSYVLEIIEETLERIKWLDGDALEDLEASCPEKAKEIDYYLHGNCDEWVLEHFQDGDIAVIWNEFDEDIGKVALVHCYIQRGDVFLDVRGKTVDEDHMEEGFDYGYDHGKIYCSSLEEYKAWIRDICGCKDEKWAKGLDSIIHDAKEKTKNLMQQETAKASNFGRE